MATITVTVPDALVPTLADVARAWLVTQGQDASGLTNGQAARRWLAGMMRQAYVVHRAETGAASARTTAETDAAGIA